MKLMRLMTATATAALLSVPASAALWDDYDNQSGYDGFESGMSEMGVYDGWDSDNDGNLAEGEFATGMYSSWDTNDDAAISEQEFTAGNERWYGADNDADFDAWDEDGSGAIEQQEFGANWNSDYYSEWDGNGDGVLNDSEFNEGVYNTADLDDDQYIEIEEEGFFEGWFDGDDIEAEVEEVGDVM
ncbi:hypothetical protein AB9K41_02085 [Cribrihabitans sp. XS_ASV171]